MRRRTCSYEYTRLLPVPVASIGYRKPELCKRSQCNPSEAHVEHTMLRIHCTYVGDQTSSCNFAIQYNKHSDAHGGHTMYLCYMYELPCYH
jgi:hypothetical protein